MDQFHFVKVSSGSGSDYSKSQTKRKKQKGHGPFYFFMMEKKAEWVQDGVWDESMSMKQLADKVTPLWNILKMNPVLLEPYVQKAYGCKANEKGDLENVFDTTERSLAEIRREACKIRDKMNDMSEEIRKTVEEAQVGGLVTSKRFFVAHFNYLCKTMQEDYPPCEAAIVEFSLEAGVTRTWHKFISPLQSVPLGYKFRCVEHARNTHYLTPDFEEFETDYVKVLESMMQFLGVGNDQESLPPLYVVPDHLPVADWIMKFILDSAKSQIKPKVYLLTKLLQEIANFPSDVIADAVMQDNIRNSSYRGLGCDLHETLGNFAHCSLSIAQRWVFNMVSPCCQLYQLPLKPGKHYPQEKHVTLHPSMINMDNLAIEDRINRKIPTPGGITETPRGLDEESEKMLEKQRMMEGKRRRRMVAEFDGEFPASDFREKQCETVIKTNRPVLVKSGINLN